MHLVPEHNELFMKLHNQKKEGFTSTQFLSHQKVIINDDEINDVVTNETTKQKNHFFSSNKIRFQSAEYVQERTANTYGKYNIRSSETEVTYLLNYERGYMDFEFSIPKYLYGHNLAQFIPQADSRLFKKNTNITEWETQKNILFKRFNSFIYAFLQDLFYSMELEYQPNMNYVELVRFDLCYNQYFESKELALAYMNEQKKLQKKSKIYNPDTNADFKTTIAWRTQNGNYFKIYHKGSEYINQKHGDFKKHVAINNAFLDLYHKNKLSKKQKGVLYNEAFYLTQDEKVKSKLEEESYKKHEKNVKNLLKKSVNGETFHITDAELQSIKSTLLRSEDLQPINTRFLKDEMDKILRYEVSITGKYASYQFKNYVFRKNCPIHKEAKKIYKKVKNQLESPERLDIKIPKYHMTLYKTFHKWLNKSNTMVLSRNSLLENHCRKAGFDFDKLSNVYQISDAYKEMCMGTDLEQSSIGIFNNAYLVHMVDKFKKTILDFQITELEPFDTLLKRVIRFNENVEENKSLFNSKSISSLISFNPKYNARYQKILLRKNASAILRTDLLTESDKQNRGLQKINFSDMSQLFNLMEDEKLSVHEIQEKLSLTKGQYYRRRKNLKLLGISENHIAMKIPIKPKIDFYTYYFKTGGYNYKQNFFFKKIHSKFS